MKKLQKPKISVIMSVYNGMTLGPQIKSRTASSAYLKEAVKSILSQTYKNFEFIIVDDVSTDKTWEYLRSLKDKRIKLIKNKKNLGLARSLNVALQQAQGDYIARMDADDVSLPNRFEKQVNFMLKNPSVGLCGTWAKLIDERNKVIGEVKKPLDDKNIKRMNMWITGIIHPTWLGRKLIFNKLKGYDTRYDLAEDLDFLIRAKKFTMANISEVLLLWRSPQKRRSYRDIEVMYRKSLSVRWNHFRKGNLSNLALIFLARSVISTFLFPTGLKIFLNKKAGLI